MEKNRYGAENLIENFLLDWDKIVFESVLT
jgi:hypothetical protein